MHNHFFTFIILPCLFLLDVIMADDHGVVFLYPPVGLTVNYKDTVNVSYTSNFGSPQLVTFCNEAGSNAVITELISYPSPYNGSQTVFFQWQEAVLCWFDLRPNSSSDDGSNSPSFTVLSNERAVSTVLGLPQATPSPSSTTSNPAATTTSMSTSTGTSHAKAGGKHNGTAIGVGVGVVVGVFVIAAAVLAFFLLRRRKSKAETDYQPAAGSPGFDGTQWQHGTDHGAEQMYMKSMKQELVKPQELSTEVTHELHDEPVRHEMHGDSAIVTTPPPV